MGFNDNKFNNIVPCGTGFLEIRSIENSENILGKSFLVKVNSTPGHSRGRVLNISARWRDQSPLKKHFIIVLNILLNNAYVGPFCL